MKTSLLILFATVVVVVGLGAAHADDQTLQATVPVCVLPGDADDSDRLAFAECLSGYDCDYWIKFYDEENHNIAMVCNDDYYDDF